MGIVPTKSAERLRRLTARPVVIGRFAAHIRLVQTAKARAFLVTPPFRALDGREGGGGDGGGSESRDGIAILGTAPQASGAAIVAAPTRSGKSTQVNRCSHHCCLASPSLSFFIGIGIGIFWIILLDWIPFDLPSSICALQKIC